MRYVSNSQVARDYFIEGRLYWGPTCHFSSYSRPSQKTHSTRFTFTMKLKEIHRTSTFAWSPFASLPLLATGTVAGALDESFSNESQLEIWAPDFLDRDEFYLGAEGQHGPRGQVKDTARFVYFALVENC